MPPLVLALIDSVFALAFHHDARATRGSMADHESAAVHATVSGPEFGEPTLRGLEICVRVSLVRRGAASEEGASGGRDGASSDPQRRYSWEDEVRFQVDFEEERLLAGQLALAELPLDRSGLARLIGELEAWCYARIPIEKVPREGAGEGEGEGEGEAEATTTLS